MLHPTSLAFLSLSVLAVVGVWGPFLRDGGFDEMSAVEARHPSTRIPALQRWPDLDRGIMSIAAFNLSAVNSQAYCFMVQFLANLVVVPVILCTEDSLAGPGSWVRYSTIWGLLAQMCTSAVIYPLYAISFIRESSRKTVQTHQPLSDLALILELVVGYAIPAALSLRFLRSSYDVQIWGILAFTVYPLCMTLTGCIIKLTRYSRHQTRCQNPPITISAWRYVVAGGMALQGHLWYLATVLGVPAGRASTLGAEVIKPDGGPRIVLRFLQIDYAITFLAMLFLAWHELTWRKILPVWSAFGGLMIGWILLGPGATLAGAWFIRGRFIGAPGVRKKRA